MSRIAWGDVLERAREIVRSYRTPVTLRQLFYRLVSTQILPNTTNAYKNLSRVTAEARRNDEFPDLADRGREIHVAGSWSSPESLLMNAAAWYRRDRTEGQERSLYLGVEKAGMVMQLESWFGHFGIPVLALGGYSSQTYVDDVVSDVERRERPAVLLYAGDFDPSGEDIDRDFIARSDCWSDVVRVALSADQVREHRLPINPGKTTDSRAAGFVERHGTLMQVELDALDPNTLRDLYRDAVGGYWDTSAYNVAVHREVAERERLIEVAQSFAA